MDPIAADMIGVVLISIALCLAVAGGHYGRDWLITAASLCALFGMTFFVGAGLHGY